MYYWFFNWINVSKERDCAYLVKRCWAQGFSSASVFCCISLQAHFSGCRNQECPGRMGRRPEQISSDPSGSCYYTILSRVDSAAREESRKFLLPPPRFNQRSPHAWPVTNDHPTHIILERIYAAILDLVFFFQGLLPTMVCWNTSILVMLYILLLNWVWILICLQSMMRLEIDTNWTPCGIG